MSKDKSTSVKEPKYNFDVFNNYKCDGQFVMIFDEAGVTIKEELTVENDSCTSK